MTDNFEKRIKNHTEIIKTLVEIGRIDEVEEVLKNIIETEKKLDRPKIVCLCGSTKFMDNFFEANWNFTLKGYIVLSVGCCKHSDINGVPITEFFCQDAADRLDELHLRKIDLADEVFVLNVGGYIGKSTSKEIEYAKKIGKSINYLEETK